MKIALCLLTRNERPCLEVVLPKLPKPGVASGFDEVFAIDGGSTDGTVELLKEYGIPIVAQSKGGRGQAFLQAFKEINTDAYIFFSPDGNEALEDLPKFSTFLTRGADLVIASRMMKGAVNEEDIHFFKWRKWANNFFNLLANVFFRRQGPYITDSINGYRAIKKQAAETLQLDASDYTIEYQMTMRAFEKRLNIVEFPTIEGQRIAGETGASSIPTGIRFLKRFFNEIFKKRDQNNLIVDSNLIEKEKNQTSGFQWHYIIGAALIFVFIGYFFANHTFLHVENWTYIINMLVPTDNFLSEASKVFHVCAVDACVDRFRPVGVGFQIIDAHLLVLLNSILPIGFKSISNLVFSLACGFMIYQCLREINPSLDRRFKFVIASYSLLLPPFLLVSGTYFRPTKTLAALAGSFIFYLWLKYSKKEADTSFSRREKLKVLLDCVLMWLFTLGDEQVILFIAIIIAVSGFQWIVLKRNKIFPLMAFSVMAMYIFSIKVIAPITYRVYHQYITPGFSDLSYFLQFNVRILKGAFYYVFYLFGNLVGNLEEYGVKLISVLSILVGILVMKKVILQRRDIQNSFKKLFLERDKGTSLVIYLLFFSGIWTMLYLLGLRHEPVIGFREGYYSVAPTVFLWLTTLWVLNEVGLLRAISSSKVFLPAIILFSILSINSAEKVKRELLPSPVFSALDPKESLNKDHQSEAVYHLIFTRKDLPLDYFQISPEAKRLVDYFRTRMPSS